MTSPCAEFRPWSEEIQGGVCLHYGDKTGKCWYGGMPDQSCPWKESPVRTYKRPRKEKTPETMLKDSAKELLAMYRITTWPLTAGMGSQPGLPDRIGILPGGRFLAIEFKANGRKLTDFQEVIKQEIEAAGGKYVLCRSLEDLHRELELPGLFV